MPKLKILRVGAVDFEVVYDELLGADGALGELQNDRCRIRLQSGLPEQREKLVLWHETVHAILYAAGFGDQDEQMVEALAQGIVAALRDNGEVLK